MSIRGLPRELSATIYGVDAIQALWLAMAFAGDQVGRMIEMRSSEWANVPNYGFPPMPPDSQPSKDAPGRR